MRHTGGSCSWMFLFVVLIALVPPIAAESSVSSDLALEKDNATDTIWLNDDIQVETDDGLASYDPAVLSATCGSAAGTTGNLSIGSEMVREQTTINSTIDRSTVTDAIEAQTTENNRPGTYTATLSCGNSTHNDTATVGFIAASIDYSIEAHGSGFVNDKLGESGLTPSETAAPARVDLSVAPSNISLSDLDHQFQVAAADDNLAEIREYKADVIEKDPGAFALRLYMNSFLAEGDGFDLQVSFMDDLVLQQELRPAIYSWTIDTFNEQPPYQLDYSDIGNEFSYDVEATNIGGADELHSDDFTVSVYDRGEQDYVYEDREWMTLTDPESGRYRVSLDHLPNIDRGTYDFELSIRNDNGEPDKLLIDSVRVTRAQQFSGRVMDSSSRGILTEMLLEDVEGRSIPIQTETTGRYSVDVEAAISTASLTFFDRQQSQPDAKFDISNPDLTESSQLSSNGEEIGFEYWTSPGVDIDGVEPINMMAIRFGYDINSESSAVMRFNPTGINFDDIEVYECNDWNFMGQECFSDWSKIDGEEVNVAPLDNTVNIEELDLHEVSEATAGTAKDILMNAYVVGVPSALSLEGQPPISLNKERVAAGGELDIAGTVVDSVGQAVENANVTLNLLDDEADIVTSYEETTDSTGFFRVTEQAPDEAGEYRMQVELAKEPYNPYAYTSRDFLEVYWDMGISLRGTEQSPIEMGESSDLSFEIANTGQLAVEDLDVEISGVSTEFYDLSSVPSSIESGDTETVTLTATFPEDYCPAPCTDPPVFDISVTGDANGETVQAQTSLFTEVDRENEDAETEETSQTDDGGNLIGFSQLQPGQVGAVIQSQSDVNIALGMIFIFLLLLAIAIKRKNGQDTENGRGRGERPVVQKPKVSSSTSDSDEQHEETEDTDEEITVSDHEDEKYVCEQTGETFDTKEALEMYKKMNDIE